MSADKSSSSSENTSTSPLNNWRSTVSCSGAEPNTVTWKARSRGSEARNSRSNRPAGVSQSISPAHQFLVEGMFARADAQKIKRLLDEPVADLWIAAQPPRQRLLPWPQLSGFLADEQPRRQTRLAPGSVRSCDNLLHGPEATGVVVVLQSR